MDPLLYGHNTEERVVAIQLLNDQTIRLYKRIEGKIIQKDIEFFPFFFLSNNSLLKDYQKKFWLKELIGTNYYRFIAAFTKWNDMWDAISHILREYKNNQSAKLSTYHELKELYVRNNPIRQFLLQSGITHFKKMEFEQILRASIDVIVSKELEKKTGGKNIQEKILVISIVVNNGKKHAISAYRKDEKGLLEKFINLINEIDPDIIEGFDLFSTILPTLYRASERQQIPLTIGRGDVEMRTPSNFSSIRYADSEWSGYEVAGRNLIDTHQLVESELELKNADQSIGLFTSAKNFDIRIDLEKIKIAQHINELWKNQPSLIKEFSLYRAEITQKLNDLLLPHWFYLAQMCPLNFRMLLHSGTTARIESLMLRAYTHSKHSIPIPMEGSKSTTIPSEIFNIGIFSNVLYVEIDQLYATIIQKDAIKPKSDSLNIFQQLLAKLISEMDSIQSSSFNNTIKDVRIKSVRSLIESFHVYIGSPKVIFNDIEQAEIIASKSRESLKEIINQIEIFNATIIQFNGRGFFLTAPDNISGEISERSFINRISSSITNGAKLTLRQRYQRMLSYRKNNYALLDYNNNLVVKGNHLISNGMEKYLRIFIQRFIECLLTNDLKRLHHAYATAYTQIVKHQWTPFDFCITEIAKTDTITYKEERKNINYPLSPALEAAIRSSVYVNANAKISYYISGTEKEPIITNSSRLIEEWDPNHPDENTIYYLSHLQEAIHRFKEFFEPTALERFFSLDEIFGFSDEGINILSRKITPEMAESKPTTEDYSIWLAETE